MNIDNPILRIIDVNLNRAKEGLRVCEDVTRFILNDLASTRALKSLRHRIHNIIESSGISAKLLHSMRNIKDDCGTGFCGLEKKDKWQAVFSANMQRSKEALRVLEEFSKLIKTKMGAEFKALRFKLYQQEKRLTEKYFK
jgi:thiamine-phosphate pyrophosphorylase